MKTHHALSVALLATLAPGQAAPQNPRSPDGLPKLPSNLSPTFPFKGVDHVVTYASWRGWGPKGGDRAVLFRHGGLVRTESYFIGSKRDGEEAHTTQFSNLDTAAWLSVTRDGRGSLTAVELSRGGVDDIPIFRHTIVETDASETIAGESCLVWLAKPATTEGVNYTACITRDGVVLRETVLYTDGSVMDEKRAIKVERRAVQPREVLPPADALNWPQWAARTAATTPQVTEGPDNYELRLAGERDRVTMTKMLRKAGGWSSEEDRAGPALRDLLVFGPAVTLSYYDNGHPRLAISEKKTSFLMDPRWLTSAPLTKPAETVLGESCAWFNAAVNVNDYGRLECRTRDHLPLIRSEYSWASLSVKWVATSLTRGRTPSGSIAPPPLLMDWTYWGWPQLAKRR